MTNETDEEREKSEEGMREWVSSINFLDEDGNPVRPALIPDKMDLGEEESLEPEDQMTDEEYNETVGLEVASLGEDEEEDQDIEDEEDEK
jgi:hypothetical protein